MYVSTQLSLYPNRSIVSSVLNASRRTTPSVVLSYLFTVYDTRRKEEEEAAVQTQAEDT